MDNSCRTGGSLRQRRDKFTGALNHNQVEVQQITLTDMKSQEPKDKKFRQLSDEELEKVNGGMFLYERSSDVCISSTCNPGEEFDFTPGVCKCVPVPNTGRAK